MKLAGKTALITGAAKRIGREIALMLAEAGSDIVIHYNQSRSEALRLKEEIEDLGVTAILVRADFSSTKKSFSRTLHDFLTQLDRHVQRVDVLVNNASVFYPTPFGKITEKEWDEMMTVNLKAPFFLAQAIGKRMAKQRSGKIINLLDWSILRPPVNYLPYAISKAGLMAATAGLARALAPHVQVNSVAPGPVLPSRGMSPKQKQMVIRKTLLKRFGEPRDIAQTVRFLVEGTDFVTGVFIPVDGGSLIA